MEQTTLSWWWYGNDEDSILDSTFRNVALVGIGVVAGPMIKKGLVKLLKRGDAKSASGPYQQTTLLASQDGQLSQQLVA